MKKMILALTITGVSVATAGGVTQAADPPILTIEEDQRVDETVYVFGPVRNPVPLIDPAVLIREPNPIASLDCVSTPGPFTSKAEFKSAVVWAGVPQGIVFC